MSPSFHILRAALAAWLTLSVGQAQNWPHWRGPNFDGSTEARNLPVEFSKTNNVKWVASLPGPSAATPVIWGDHVFVSSTDTRTKTLRAMAVDRKTGEELWNQRIAEGINKDDRSNFASPSPTTDGSLVFFYYGNGDLAAFDFSGKQAWARNIQKDYGQFATLWTYSTSPTLADGKLIIQVLQRDVPVQGRGRADGPNDPYLLALDPKTGKELWRHVRPCAAQGESREAFTTPVPCAHGDRSELIVAGGDCISGHDLKTGAENWRWETWNPERITHWRLVPSPVVGAGLALACGPKGAPIYAVKLGGKGALNDSGLAWVSAEREISSDVSTPAFYQGRLYVLNSDRKTMARVDPATGKAEWVGDLGTRVKLEASPTVADGKLYAQNFRGEVFIVAADKEFKLLHVAAMGGEEDDQNLRSSIAIAGSNLFVRTGSKLYCIGK